MNSPTSLDGSFHIMSPRRPSLLSQSSDLGNLRGQSVSKEKYDHEKYTIGWICMLPKEQTAATAMLDERHMELPKQLNDPNTYILGSVCEHKIAIACLPQACAGSNAAATVAVWLTCTFPSIRLCLLVGIASGLPQHVRLGNVVVAMPSEKQPGMTQWDLDEKGKYAKVGSMGRPPTILLSALNRLETEHELELEMEEPKINQYLANLRYWPKLAAKYLYNDKLVDPGAEACNASQAQAPAKRDVHSPITEHGSLTSEDLEALSISLSRKQTQESSPVRQMREVQVHHGLMACTSTAVRDEKRRNQLVGMYGDDQDQLLCIDTEAAGLMTKFPCIVIRGISNYADRRFSTCEWEGYAAAVAAAFAKEVLSVLPDVEVKRMPTIKSRGPSVF